LRSGGVSEGVEASPRGERGTLREQVKPRVALAQCAKEWDLVATGELFDAGAVQNTSIVNANEFLSLPIVAEAFMERITSAELVHDFSRHTDTAVVDPAVITRHGRDRLVLLSVKRYSELLKAAAEAETGKARHRRSEDALRTVPQRRSAA
jgi:PHD/YefM family antitoxin component YafN of YafNO toxin-antitoxin module